MTNDKILLSDLAFGLSRRSGLPKKDGDVFARSFFDILEQYLLEDKIVKIKGFGTFKVIEVSGRDSIDVNTGERIHIKGHSKISFTPDSTIRDHVNRPFADFETVILNDGVDIAAMEYVDVPDEVTIRTDSDIEPDDVPAEDITLHDSPTDLPETKLEPEEITLHPDDDSTEITLQPTDETQDVTMRPSAAPMDVTLQSAEASPDVTMQPDPEPIDITLQPSAEPQDVSMKSSDEPNDVTMKSSDEPQDVTMQPSDEPHDVTMKSSDEPHNVTMRPSDEPHDVTMRPSDEPHDVTMKPSDEQRDITMRPTIRPDIVPASQEIVHDQIELAEPEEKAVADEPNDSLIVQVETDTVTEETVEPLKEQVEPEELPEEVAETLLEQVEPENVLEKPVESILEQTEPTEEQKSSETIVEAHTQPDLSSDLKVEEEQAVPETETNTVSSIADSSASSSAHTSQAHYIASHADTSLADTSEDERVKPTVSPAHLSVGNIVLRVLSVVVLMAVSYWAGSNHLLSFLVNNIRNTETVESEDSQTDNIDDIWGEEENTASNTSSKTDNDQDKGELLNSEDEDPFASVSGSNSTTTSTSNTKESTTTNPLAAENSSAKTTAEKQTAVENPLSNSKPTTKQSATPVSKPSSNAVATPVNKQTTASAAQPAKKTTAQSTTSSGDPSQYPQVAGGAYSIVGVKCTHTVGSSDNVCSLARKYLGSSKYANYIIKLNNLSNPDIIYAGQQLKIPELKSK